MKPNIEDELEDVLAKAARGLGLGTSELGERSGLDPAAVRSLMRGDADASALRRVAPVLGLSPGALVALTETVSAPEIPEIAGLAAFTEAYPIPGYEEMTVNTYLVWDRETREAFVFDAGATGEPLLAKLKEEELLPRAVLLTHSHADHIAGLERLRAGAGDPPVFLHERETAAGAEAFEEGRAFEAGSLKVEVRLTDGHSPGGSTFVVSGLERPVAVVGDSLFCLSQGGTSEAAYARALENNRRKVLSLPDETVLCPGHGPMTTVAFEKANNPFFAD